MSTLKSDLELFENDSGDDEFSHKRSCGCSACSYEVAIDEFEADLGNLESEEEMRRHRRFRRPSGRGMRLSRRPRHQVKKRPLTKPRPPRPGGVQPPKTMPWPRKRPQRPIIVRSRRRRPVVIREPAAPCVCPTHGTEFVRWVQSSLNQVLGRRLRVNGVMNRATRDALRDFQKQERLVVDGIAGPETEQALVEAKAKQPDRTSSELEGLRLFDVDEFDTDLGEEQFLSSLWPFSSRANIVNRTSYSPKDKRKKVRNINDVYALVLHQTGFSRGNDPKRYNKVTSHFVILPNGTIVQLHPLTAYLYASNGFNKGSVAVEFVGNFPSTRGKCYKPEKFGCHKVTNEQIQAGRRLIEHLIKNIGLTHVLAHRQSSGSRGNDPGPDLWYHVGQWAINEHRLKDGGPEFKVQSGKAIPDSWRNWYK